MMLYNITIKVDFGIHANWLKWMQEVYIPELMGSNFFTSYKLSRVMGVDESDGITYSLLLSMENRATFNLYQQQKALQHQTLLDTRYGEQALSFRSLMNIIDQG